MQHAPDADQDAAAGRVLHERHLLGVEEAERLLGLEVAGEAVEQGGLVEVFLDPLRLEAEIGLALGLHVQRVLFPERLHGFAQHPRERHHRRRVRAGDAAASA